MIVDAPTETHEIESRAPRYVWPMVGPEPLGRTQAVALLNPAEFDAGEPGSWIAGPWYGVLCDVLTHTTVHPSPVRIAIYEPGGGQPTHRLTLRGAS